MKRLRDLLQAVSPAVLTGDPDVLIGGVAFDSRRVVPGDLFVALIGRRNDGNTFIAEAVRKGATAVVSETPAGPLAAGVSHIQVDNARLALSRLSAAFHDFPAHKMVVIGVTGTDGKTTTAHMISAILRAAGLTVGRVSTVDLAVGDDVWLNETNHTTPQAPQVQAALAAMVRGGARFAVVEASSHALALHRVADCAFDVAVMTNLTPEHLDFHGTMARYRDDKARLFRLLAAGPDKDWPKLGVVNADDPSAGFFRQASPAPVLTYGIDAPADVTAHDLTLTAAGARFHLRTPRGEVVVRTRLLGRFNVYNWLAASSVAVGLGLDLGAIARAGLELRGVPGRMRRVTAGQPFLVVVDFAHTPHALSAALQTLRQHVGGRILAVIGQAGGRDADNRPALARVAARAANGFIITSDDSYDENPEDIADQIEAGAKELGLVAGKDYWRILDRRDAIATALEWARPGDAVLIAGRGHEQYQVIGKRRLPFDDAAVALRLLGGIEVAKPERPAA
ncbi:MAG: UDP-N-acetylmuramoyl-L-alanyl-D-glutamate--2,6-diaminopimelate ligase [Chloroflexota bacterium]